MFDPEEVEEEEEGVTNFFRDTAIAKRNSKSKKAVTQFSSDGEATIENIGRTRSQTKKSKQ